MKKALFVFGTRPEAIKLAPLIKRFQQEQCFQTKICVTGQHRQMLDQILNFFKLKPDYDLNLMKLNQSLFDITGSSAFRKMEKILQQFKPDLIFVQGDTTTAFLGALAGYYQKIPVVHVEAGLRSYHKYSPFPEELNRRLIDHIADYLFAPTLNAKTNLAKEGINKNVWVTGNTVIDALFLGLDMIKTQGEQKYQQYFSPIDFSKKVILVTAHRRENFGRPLRNICSALKKIVARFDNVQIVYPVHLNPNIKQTVLGFLGKTENIHLINPLDYSYLIWLMNQSYLILTDSGGIQEEAPSLGKPVLVLREVTERKEGLKAGTAKLVGADQAKIIKETSTLLTNQPAYQKMAQAVNPYGDGKSSRKIINILKNKL